MAGQPMLSLLHLPFIGDVEVKPLDVRNVVGSSFSWLTGREHRPLIGAFIAAEALASVVALVATVVSLSIVAALSGPSASDVQAMIGGSLPGAAVQVVMALAALYGVLLWAGLDKDERFLSFARTIIPFRLALVLVPILGALLISALFGLSVQDLSGALSSPGISVASVLGHGSPLLAVSVMLVSAMTAAALIVWSFFCSFFIIASAYGGEKARFARFSVSNMREYAAFLLTAAFTVLFNVLSPRVFYVQAALIAFALAMLLASALFPSASALLWLAVLIFIPIAAFNAVRLFIASVARVVEDGDAKGALVSAWERSRGYAVPIAMAMAAAFVCTAALTFVLSVPPFILEVSAAYVDILAIPALVLRAFANSFNVMAPAFVSVFLGMAVYSQISGGSKRSE